jgi:hypothetical protein
MTMNDAVDLSRIPDGYTTAIVQVKDFYLRSLDWYVLKLAERGIVMTRDEVLNLILGHTSLDNVLEYQAMPILYGRG